MFDRCRAVHITLPAPAFFDHQAKGRYVISTEEATHHHAAAQEAIAAASQYNPSYYYGYPPG